MTFQIGLIGSDGIVLASDLQITHAPLGIVSTHKTRKIIYNQTPSIAYCWSGNEYPGEIAQRFILSQDSADIRGALEDAAWAVFESQFGFSYLGAGARRSDLPDGGGSLLALIPHDGIVSLWQVTYGKQICVDEILDKAISGATRNAAAAFQQMYYRENLKLEQLMPLAAHSVFMAGTVDPYFISGLEMLTWKYGETEPCLATSRQIQELKNDYEKLYALISQEIIRPVTPRPD